MNKLQQWIASKVLGIQQEQKAESIPFSSNIFSGGRLIMPADNKQSYIQCGYNINDIIYAVTNMILDKVRLPYWSLYKVDNVKSLEQYNMLMKMKDISTKDYKKAMLLKDEALSPITSTNLQTGKLAGLLKYPNDLETFEDFITYGSLYKLLTGDCYMWGDLLGGGANQGIPNQLWNLPAHLVTIGITNQFPARPASYKLMMWGLEFDVTQVLHELYANPNWNINGEQLYGFSPLRSMLRNTTRNNYAKEASISKFQNGGFEELIYVSDSRFTAEEGKIQAEAIKSRLMSREFRGPEVEGRIAVSGIPMGSVQLGRTPVELGIIDSEKWDAIMFCNAYGVPPEMLGLTQKTYNNVKEAEKALTTRSAIPLLTSRRNALNRKLTTDWGFKGQNIYIDYETSCFPELTIDQDVTSNWLDKMIMLSPDEQREYLGVDQLNTTESKEQWVKSGGGWVPLSDFQASQTDQALQGMIDSTLAGMAGNGQQQPSTNGNGKSTTFKFNENHDPHNGQFTFGNGQALFNEEVKKNPKLARWGVDTNNINDNGEYVLYHGTNSKAAEQIMNQGIKTPEGAGPTFFMLTTNKNAAEQFAIGQDNGSGFKIIQVNIPVKDITSTIWKGHETSIGGGDTEHAIQNNILDKKYIRNVHSIGKPKQAATAAN